MFRQVKTSNHNLTNLIESSTILRRALERELDYLRSLDPLPKERDKTRSQRKILFKTFGQECAYCTSTKQIEAAHIYPLEIGAETTNENLILLCHDCHTTYDAGHLSLTEMENIANRWRDGEANFGNNTSLQEHIIPPPSITQPPPELVSRLKKVLKLQRNSSHGKATTVINTALTRRTWKPQSYIYLNIKKGEITRRRSAHGTVQRANELLSSILEENIAKKYLPVYYYELGYTLRLLGRHKEALPVFQKSVDRSKHDKTMKELGPDYVASAVNTLLCELATHDKISVHQATRFDKAFKNLMHVAQKHGGYWGGRWALNCIFHNGQVWLKARKSKQAWQTLEEIRQLFYTTDTSSGWDLGTRSSLSLIEGQIHVFHPRNEKDIERGIGLLVRSFVGRIRGRIRPEGARDVGFSLAHGLEQRNTKKDQQVAGKLREVMERVVDGTSVLFPWRT